MYSMVILDDEKIVLQGIQKLCQKEDFGFVIKGAFVDSLKALDALPGLRPHLIITDVRMPQMDGLEFARRAKEILPESEIVILSGYRDFSYAQTAMQIGVSDYLLKPIKKTDFGDMLHRMYERLEAKIGQAAYYQVLDGYARGLVGEEEVKHAVSSVQPANVAQRPGVLAKEGEQSPTKIVRDALYYIRRHYNENISLTDVAEHINVNKSYLCDVFKKEQKVTILQYMTNLRIEKAKERLEAAKNAKTKAETQLEAAQEQCDKVVEEMKQLGVTPDTIEAEITHLSESVEENLKNVESNIPEV